MTAPRDKLIAALQQLHHIDAISFASFEGWCAGVDWEAPGPLSHDQWLEAWNAWRDWYQQGDTPD